MSKTGSLFKNSTNRKTNFSVILFILPSIIFPSSIFILKADYLIIFQILLDAGFERSL